jgi:choline dehydrogenase-like flavoprotein
LNLLVVTDALAEKITIVQNADGVHTATGVDFSGSGKRFHAQASREIIVSCGTFLSPQLLELSGIGSPSILSQHGVEVKVNNPNVGENLQEHVSGRIMWEADPELATPTLPSHMTTANLCLKDITPAGQDQLDLNKGIYAQKGRERLLMELANASKQAVASFLGHATGEVNHLPSRRLPCSCSGCVYLDDNLL